MLLIAQTEINWELGSFALQTIELCSYERICRTRARLERIFRRSAFYFSAAVFATRNANDFSRARSRKDFQRASCINSRRLRAPFIIVFGFSRN